MTLASICLSVAADLGITGAQPPIFGSPIPANRRLFAQARKAAHSLHRKAAYWDELVLEYEFQANRDSDFQLPPDFGWLLNDTAWESTRYWRMRGSMSPQQWRMYKNSIYGRNTIWRRYRIRVPSGGNAGTPPVFSVDPMIAATDTTSRFVFEYVSMNWCQQANGTTSNDWTADTDTSILDEYLVELGTRWRMLRRMGLQYDEEQDEYEREVDKAAARSGGTATLQLVPHQVRDFIGQYNLGAFPPTPLQQAAVELEGIRRGPRQLLGQPPVSSRVLLPSGPKRLIPPVAMSDC